MSKKGSAYERELSRKLSLWWSAGEADDLFWRSAGSGAMATVRWNKTRKQSADAGDFRAMKPQGKPLIDAFCIEAKRGYKKAKLDDLCIYPERQSEIVKLIQAAIEGHSSSESASWWLIHKRDRTPEVLVMPYEIMQRLPLARRRGASFFPTIIEPVSAIGLDLFFDLCSPDDILDLLRKD